MASTHDAPFLDPAPPAWAARALASVLLALAAIGVLALMVVRVPETVSAPFVIVAEKGADPVRSLHDGVVTAVLVTDAEQVEAGTRLFTIGSETVGDRSSERESLGASLAGGEARLVNERGRFENQRQADEQELARLAQRRSTLRTQLQLKDQQRALAAEVLVRQRKSQDEGLTSWMDVSKQALEVDRLAVEAEQARAELAEIASSEARVRFEMASRRAAFDELSRSVAEELTRGRARTGMLARDTERNGNVLSVTATCSGTIVRLVVRRPGTVVAANDTLAELTCDGEALRAEIMVPDRGMALVLEGQPVKLQYDAFPYQRYGVRFATVRWISPSSADAGPGQARAFRLLATLGEQVLRINGSPRPVRPGMSGQAAIVVGRRSLASYAFAPLRQLRESMATAPPSGAGQ